MHLMQVRYHQLMCICSGIRATAFGQSALTMSVLWVQWNKGHQGKLRKILTAYDNAPDLAPLLEMKTVGIFNLLERKPRK